MIRRAWTAARNRTAVVIVTSVGLSAVISSQSLEQVSTPAQNREKIEALLSGLPYVPGELLVQFRAGLSQQQLASALRVMRVGGDPPTLEWIGDTLHVSGLIDADLAAAAAALERQPEVLFAQPNYIRHLHSTPNDPGYSSQWHMITINMPQAWEITKSGGSGVTVAVLDTGLTTAQGTFGFRIWNGQNFTISAVPFVPVMDFDHARIRGGVEFALTGPWVTGSGQAVLFDSVGHGTHVAGTIAQYTNNSSGYAGVATGVTLMPVKVCFGAWDLQLWAGAAGVPGRAAPEDGGCADADVARGIRYAVDNGAKVINLSLGGPFPAPAQLEALRYATERGVFVAVSAGNEALRGNPTLYPAAYAPGIDGVVSVSAITRSRERALYSSYGPSVEVVAPGGAGFLGPAEDVWQVYPEETDLDITRRVAPAFQRYVGKGIAGTSMASPHVAGVAALLYSQGITSPTAIEAALKRFAVDLGRPGRDDEYGHGLIDARASLRGLGVAR